MNELHATVTVTLWYFNLILF